MIKFDQARHMAVDYIKGIGARLQDGDELVLVDASTIEKPWGWVFSYHSKLYLETEDFQYALGGNVPILIERETGRMLLLGSAYQKSRYIENYERTGDPHRFD